jgi:hypothetical protein
VLGQPVEDGLHRVVSAAVPRRQLLADLLDGAGTHAPQGGHQLQLKLALNRVQFGHDPSMPLNSYSV